MARYHRHLCHISFQLSCPFLLMSKRNTKNWLIQSSFVSKLYTEQQLQFIPNFEKERKGGYLRLSARVRILPRSIQYCHPSILCIYVLSRISAHVSGRSDPLFPWLKHIQSSLEMIDRKDVLQMCGNGAIGAKMAVISGPRKALIHHRPFH